MPKIFSVEEFRAKVATEGLARQNRFQVDIPGAPTESLLCESASLPGMNLAVRSQKLFGPNYYRAVSADYGGAGILLNFYVDRNMEVKKFFDNWMHKIVNPGEFTVNYYNVYTKDITLYQVDNDVYKGVEDGSEFLFENTTYEMKLIQAFPISMGPLQLSQGAVNTFHILPITFAYRYWDSSTITNSSQIQPISGIEGPEIKNVPISKEVDEMASRATMPAPPPVPEPRQGIGRNVPTQPIEGPNGAAFGLYTRP